MRSEFVSVGSIGSRTPTLGLLSNTSHPLLLVQSLHLRPARQEPNSVGSIHRLHLHTKFLNWAKEDDITIHYTVISYNRSSFWVKL